jgi:hypothetical protein
VHGDVAALQFTVLAQVVHAQLARIRADLDLVGEMRLDDLGPGFRDGPNRAMDSSVLAQARDSGQLSPAKERMSRPAQTG